MSDETITIELNPREQRLYERLRSRMTTSERSAGTGPRDLVLLLPDLTVLLMRLLRDRRVPRGGKVAALLGVGYVLSPIDLLPAIIFGPLGWLDDAFVVTAALGRILNDVHPDIVRSHWSGSGDALEAIQRVTRWTQSLVTGRIRRALPGSGA